jgi:phosphatidate cytidylyltransferase
MLRQRLIVAIIFVPLIFAVVAYGRWVYPLMIAIFMGFAAAEYGQLFRRANLRPSILLLVIGTVGLCFGRDLSGFNSGPVILTALIMAAMAWHLVDYERGAARSGTDFAVTVSGTAYLGWLGAYLISLRQLPDGAWWVLLTLPTIWLSDSAAYLVGRRWGRHPMTPRLSPRKTWEGYLSGVVAGAISGTAIATLWGLGPTGAATLTPVRGLILGLALAVLAPVGDFGISMFKREMGVKDTSALVPGHGGALDRTDSWVWAGVLAFYIVTVFTN